VLVQYYHAPIFAKILINMEAKKSRAKNWVYFTLWLAALVTMLILPDFRQWFWLALPGVATHFAYGMDLV